MTVAGNNTERDVIVGLPNTGKTEWTKKYIRAWQPEHRAQGTLIFDILSEYNIPGATIYRPDNRTEPRAEIEKVTQNLLITPYQQGAKKTYGLVIYEEASRYMFPRVPLGPQFGYINDFARHMELSVAVIARRLSQVHTDWAELAARLVIFRQTGKNDLKALSEIREGLDDAVLKLRGHQHIEYYEGEITQYP